MKAAVCELHVTRLIAEIARLGPEQSDLPMRRPLSAELMVRLPMRVHFSWACGWMQR